MSHLEWKKGIDYPEFMDEPALQTLSHGYLLEGETPKVMYQRVAKAAADTLKRPDLESKFFDYIWKGWLCLASPVAANLGSSRGLPISCFGQFIPDTMPGIFDSFKEMAMMGRYGGGLGLYWGAVRARGSRITNNGFSNGVIPFLKVQDSITASVSQGNVRKGASVAYLDATHGDIHDFLRIRRPQGDINLQCPNINHGVVVDDNFMEDLNKGQAEARKLWGEILMTRAETGEPYVLFIDNVNKVNPECYQKRNLKVVTSQLCIEIFLNCDENHSFVCCLSSLNLVHYEKWKDTDLVETAVYFLDAVMGEYIRKASEISGLEKAVRFSKKSRALGLGALGYHTMLQRLGIPFDSFQAKMLNKHIFREISEKAKAASRKLATEYGECEWTEGSGTRNTHVMAVAPTVSNSIMQGGVSQGIEPIAANAFYQKTAKGNFIRKNRDFEQVLENYGKNSIGVWESIISNDGSVQHLDFLTASEREVFLTAREISQMALIEQAGDRQQFIDQGQSLNLFFPANVDKKYFNRCHIMAHELGVKSLYYNRSTAALKGDVATRQNREATEGRTCSACEG